MKLDTMIAVLVNLNTLANSFMKKTNRNGLKMYPLYIVNETYVKFPSLILRYLLAIGYRINTLSFVQ